MNTETITASHCVVRNTASKKGRTRAVTPGATAAKHLHYGRIILDAGSGPLRFATGEHETALICLKGGATVDVDGSPYSLGRFDSLYVPRESEIAVAPGPTGCDFAELSAPVSRRHPVQFIAFADVQKDSGLHFEAGGPSARIRDDVGG